METEITFFVARVVALIYIPLGIGMVTGQISAKELFSSYEKSAALTLWIGIFAVLAGTFVVSYHNIWVKGWPVLVTLLGWIGLVEGVTFIAFPKRMLKAGKMVAKNEKAWGAFALLAGLVFGYFGFLV
jgi:hypothetical protein